MKDKSIQFVEKLLRGYKSLKAERLNLNNKWNILERQRSQAIEGEFLRSKTMTDMPGTPYGGYKEQRIMIARCGEIDDIINEQSFIMERLKDIEDILTIVDNSFNSIPLQDKDILFFYYVEQYSLQKIAGIVYIHPDNVCKRKYHALQYMYKSVNILEGTVIFKAA